MTLTTPPEQPTHRSPRHIPAPKRREPAPAAAFGWRWVFPFVLVALAGVVYLLAVTGARAVLDTSGGRTIEPVTDPALPGYEVLVEPTEVLLLASVDESDTLVGVTVLVPTAGQQGGTIITAEPTLAVAPDDGTEPFRFVDVYAAEGLDGLATRMGQLLRVGATSTAVLDPGGMELLLDPLGGLTVDLPDALVVAGSGDTLETIYPSGELDLEPDEVPEVFAHVNPGESPVNRIGRQVDIWDAWLDALADGGEVPELEIPITDTLAAMQGGTVVQERLPFHVRDIPMDDGSTVEFLVVDNAAAQDLALRVVPFPVGADGVPRVPVRLLNATSSLTLEQVVTEFGTQLVAADSRVVVIGNADPMARQTSEILTTEAGLPDAERLAAVLGIEEIVMTSRHPTVAALTVIVGEDLVG